MKRCRLISTNFAAHGQNFHDQHFFRRRSFLLLVYLMSSSLAFAQTNRVSTMRDLRIACLETFSTSQERLQELGSFVEQETGRQRAAADQLFQLRQSVDSAKRKISDLEQKQAITKSEFEQDRTGIERAVTSYKAAGQSLPKGETWADEGAKAIAELRRAADATPRDQWKHLRVKEAETQFSSTLHDWRAARREFERAGFDLELRAATVTFDRISNQLTEASTELSSLDGLLKNRERSLILLTTNSDKWAASIRELNRGNAESKKRLAKVAFDFHLVDLKFTAWRLNQAGLAEEGISSLPDILEHEAVLNFNPSPTVNSATPIGGLASLSAPNSAGVAQAANEEAATKPAEESPEPDAKFRELLDRVNLQTGRLQFLLEAWNAESANVKTAIDAVESSGDNAKALADETAGLAADLETLRRSTESTKTSLTAGLATMDLVQKRYSTDLQEINHLLDQAMNRTTQLQKSLDQP
jgi:chromosome segregation ATPase